MKMRCFGLIRRPRRLFEEIRWKLKLPKEEIFNFVFNQLALHTRCLSLYLYSMCLNSS